MNTISPGEEQMNKQAKYQPYVVDTILMLWILASNCCIFFFFTFYLTFPPLDSKFSISKARVNSY